MVKLFVAAICAVEGMMDASDADLRRQEAREQQRERAANARRVTQNTIKFAFGGEVPTKPTKVTSDNPPEPTHDCQELDQTTPEEHVSPITKLMKSVRLPNSSKGKIAFFGAAASSTSTSGSFDRLDTMSESAGFEDLRLHAVVPSEPTSDHVVRRDFAGRQSNLPGSVVIPARHPNTYRNVYSDISSDTRIPARPSKNNWLEDFMSAATGTTASYGSFRLITGASTGTTSTETRARLHML